MPKCFCPEELGGASHFDPVTPALSDWMPTLEHFPRPKREGGKNSPDNERRAVAADATMELREGQAVRRDTLAVTGIDFATLSSEGFGVELASSLLTLGGFAQLLSVPLRVASSALRVVKEMTLVWASVRE